LVLDIGVGDVSHILSGFQENHPIRCSCNYSGCTRKLQDIPIAVSKMGSLPRIGSGLSSLISYSTSLANLSTSSLHEAEIVSIGFACAAAVYDPEPSPLVPGFAIEQVKIITPSIGGTTKAASFAIVTRSERSQTESNPFLPMLVVSVRGTASIVDKMVNLNGTPKDMGPLVVSPTDLQLILILC
jgi:hypothetical protein